MNLTIGFWLLLWIILIEGFVTISAEILTIRQLVPVVGNSVIVTSLIIGVFLLFLAFGYLKGGTYKEHYADILKKNFTKASIFIGVGLSYQIITFFFVVLMHQFYLPELLVLLLYLFLITAPMVYWLGQTVPITMNLYRKELHVGGISGRVLHISTLGSFLGAVLTSLVLMTFLGVAWTVFINFLLLAILILLLMRSNEYMRMITLVCFTAVVYITNVSFENEWFAKTTSYADYKVVSDYTLRATGQKGKLFVINGGYGSFIDKNDKSFPHVEYIRKVLFNDLNLHDKSILVLGAGGFTLSAAGMEGNHFTYVDIDPSIKKTVEANFLNPVKGDFVVADARDFVAHSTKKYDVVFSDSYSNTRLIPSHLLVREYFEAVKRALLPEGLAIFNVIAKPTLEDRYSKRIDTTLRSVFKSCMAVPLTYNAALTNIIYLCKASAVEDDTGVYTDNKNQAMVDSFF